MAGKFRILAGTDGSPSARGALRAAIAFPWPEPSTARGVVALGTASSPARGLLRAAATRSLYAHVRRARRMLAQRWSDADVVALHEPPARAIFSEARRFRAKAIVLGWRGHGSFRRLLAGSVSREVVARAATPVLVARTAPRAAHRLVVGFDGSPSARRAIRFLSKLERPSGGAIVLVNIVEPLPVPYGARRLPASVRASLRGEVVKLNRQHAAQAQRKADAAAVLLRRAGWPAKAEVRSGAPLKTLLQAAARHKGNVLVVGARATRGLRRVLLGSVAAGALNHSRTPVLIVP